MDKNMKALLGINKFIDSDYEKLYDMLKELELSHNRKKRALCRIEQICLNNLWREDKVFVCLCEEIVKICESALFCDGRERIKNG